MAMKELCDLVCINMPRAESIRRRIPTTSQAANTTRPIQALADPTRLQILSALYVTEELCGCDIAWITCRSQNLIAHHLKQLRISGLIEPRREGKLVFYSVTRSGRSLLEAVRQSQKVSA